jgi:hypothetical protein
MRMNLWFTIVASTLLVAVATVPVVWAPAAAAQAIETVKMGAKYGEYPVAVVKIPVDDGKTKFVAAALFEPEGAGPFPAVIILSGCAGVGPDAVIVRRVNADYLPKGIATLVVESSPAAFSRCAAIPTSLRPSATVLKTLTQL